MEKVIFRNIYVYTHIDMCTYMNVTMKKEGMILKESKGDLWAVLQEAKEKGEIM